jgi:putative membrane protein
LIRYIRYLFLMVLAVCLLTVALANRGPASLNLLPGELSELSGISFQIQLPMFIIVLGSIVVGLLIGFVWEWLREHKHRVEASRRTQEAKTLAREVVRLKDVRREGRDDVLALLE